MQDDEYFANEITQINLILYFKLVKTMFKLFNISINLFDLYDQSKIIQTNSYLHPNIKLNFDKIYRYRYDIRSDE